VGWRYRCSRTTFAGIDDGKADLGAIPRVVARMAGRVILIDLLVDTFDASLDERVGDVHA
jgi:hypothetical protein